MAFAVGGSVAGCVFIIARAEVDFRGCLGSVVMVVAIICCGNGGVNQDHDEGNGGESLAKTGPAAGLRLNP